MERFGRRSFIKGLVAGGAVLGAIRSGRAQQASSRVVSVTDGAAWVGDGWTDADLDPDRVRAMLARALVELTGEQDAIAALRSLIPGLGQVQARIAIKVNCVNAELPTHPTAVGALCGLLVDAGAGPDQLVVFDRTSGELAACGYTVRETGGDYACVGTDHRSAGYREEPVVLGDVQVRPSELLSGADHLVSFAVCKNHEMAGLTGCLKNHYGSVDRPDLLHGWDRDCCPGIAELNARPLVRDSQRLCLVDALYGSYRSGLGAKPDFAPMALLASTDPVAIDAVTKTIIDTRRAADGLDPVTARHLSQAAELDLGRADPADIDHRAVVLSPPVEKPKPWERTAGDGCATAGRGGAGGLAVAAGAAAALRCSRSGER